MWMDLRLPMDDCDFFIYLWDLPLGIGGFVLSNDDGTYSMILNKHHFSEQLNDDYWHEYIHIAFDDFNSVLSIEEIEKRANM